MKANLPKRLISNIENSHPTTLRRLPVEIRVMIYRLGLKIEQPDRALGFRRGVRFYYVWVAPTFLKALRSDQALYAEALKVYYEINEFLLVPNTFVFDEFRNELGETALSLLRNLKVDISYVGTYSINLRSHVSRQWNYKTVFTCCRDRAFSSNLHDLPEPLSDQAFLLSYKSPKMALLSNLKTLSFKLSFVNRDWKVASMLRRLIYQNRLQSLSIVADFWFGSNGRNELWTLDLLDWVSYLVGDVKFEENVRPVTLYPAYSWHTTNEYTWVWEAPIGKILQRD